MHMQIIHASYFFYLNGSWAQGKQLITGSLGIAIHIN